MNRREELLQGIISFPKQIMDFMNPNEEQKILIKGIWDALCFTYLSDKNVSAIVWSEKFGDEKYFNKLLKHLCDSGWVISNVSNNYATLEINNEKLKKWINQEEINNLKYKHKCDHYLMTNSKSTLYNTVQIGNTWKETGLVRKGFMKAGNNQFSYDQTPINKYAKYIAYNIDKDFHKSTKEVTYNEIVNSLVDYYGKVKDTYTLGNNVCDSRGRSIFQCSKKIFNPVSHKDARASLICKSEPLTTEGYKAVYAFISELLGYRGKNYEDKVKYGESMYILHTLPNLEEMIENKDFSELHVRIWLERIYNALDNYNDKEGWNIPIEIDAMASMLQFMAILTNDHKYMEMTNLIGDTFNDAWSLPYCTRNMVKKAVTPRLYGSSKEPKELWDSHKMKYTQDQINKITEEIRNGLYANANNFKDFIIGNVQPKEIMKVSIWGQQFEIRCNRFKPQRMKTIEAWIYTGQQKLLKKVVHHVEQVPDCEQFKRYFVTLLLHHLDSRVADYICQELDWVLPNHDAFTLHPNDVSKCRKLYTDKLYEIYKDRHNILREYFDSIGIIDNYNDVCKEEVERFSPYCLK